VKAHNPSWSILWLGEMPLDIDELFAALAEAFALHPHAINVLSLDQASGVYVNMSSQADLDIVIAEMNDEGMHALTLEVSGVSLRRNIDAAAFCVSCAATVMQLLYVVALKMWPAPEDISLASKAETLISAVALINFSATLYLLDQEWVGEFKEWMRGWQRVAFVWLAAPLTVEVVPFIASRTFGMDAPLRDSTRVLVIKWSVLMLLLQDCSFLWMLLVGNSEGLLSEDAVEETDSLAVRQQVMRLCTLVTLANVIFNFPRRTSAWAVARCESAWAAGSLGPVEGGKAYEVLNEPGAEAGGGGLQKRNVGAGGRTQPKAMC